jgi:phosphate transport system substrate-binding protein
MVGRRYLQIVQFLVGIFLVAGCSSLDRQVKVGGGYAALSGFVLPVKETFEEETGLSLAVVVSDPGRELIDLKNGSIDVIVSAASLDELLKEAAEKQVSIDRALLQEVPVGKNQTVIFLNKSIRIGKLTKKQLKGIFTGRITNWKQVGWRNRDIVVVWTPFTVGENDAFVKGVLDGEPVVSSYVPAKSFEDVRKTVMETPGAIGIGPNALIASVVKVPHTPAVASPVVVITRGEPSSKVKKLIALLKDVEIFP